MSVYANSQSQPSQSQSQQQKRHQQRLNELLDAVKQEFDFAFNEASNYSKVKEDYDLKCNQQTAEMQQIRQTVYELEMAHRKIKEAYEEEILRLKTELENRDRQAHSGKPNGAPTPQYPYSYQQQQQQQQPQQPQPPQQPQQPQPPHQQQQQQPPPPHSQPPSQPASIKPPKTEAKKSPNVSRSEPVKDAPKSSEFSSALTVVDKSQYIVNPQEKNLHVKEIPPFLSDLDVAKANPDFKKQTPEFYVLYNPAFKRDLDVDLIQSLDHSSVVCCVKFSKNGEFIATGCNKTTQVFDVKTGALIAKLIDDNSSNSNAVEGEGDGDNKDGANSAASANANGDLYIRSVCFSPDGKLLATGAEDKLIRIWDLSTKRIIKILRGHEQDIYSLDFFPDGDRLVSGSGDRTVRIWDLRSSQCSLTLSIEDGVTTVAVSPNGKLIAAGSLDKTVRVWDSSTGFLVERLDSGNESGNGHQDSVYSVAFSTNGNQIASGSLDRTVKLWNLEGKAEGAVSGQSIGKKSSCEVTYIGHKDFVLSVCSTPDSEYILSGSKDRGVIFWDQFSGNPLLMLQGHRNSVISVATLKYWGKRDKTLNLPTNSSISVTLDQQDLRTLTSAATSADFKKDNLWLNGKEEGIKGERTIACLKDLKKLRKELEDSDSSLPKFSEWGVHIVSENNFPTAAGLASSAAGFAALVSAIAKLYKLPQSMSEISKIARKGSGSACRSLFGGYVAWEMGDAADGSDSKAVEVAPVDHWPSMKAAILVVSDDKKDTPSTTGMQSTVATSDLFQYRIKDVVPKRFEEMKQAIQERNFEVFGDLTMKDSNSFHAVCLDTVPPIFYLNDTSKKIIKLIHKLNEQEGKIIAAYTFDAGPNAVVYYEEQNENKVLGLIHKYFHQVPGWEKVANTKSNFVDSDIEFDNEAYKGVSRIILTQVGPGPQETSQTLVNDSGLPK
ncbi:hypothetical protein FT662_05063 [Candidozyma haemuli var. vulneris]|nr:hypothetical protein FT662_05063 [[Candida] haemuloni var. vulneris]